MRICVEYVLEYVARLVSRSRVPSIFRDIFFRDTGYELEYAWNMYRNMG